jgi:Zn-finger in ubiquitin-hydrolases and other protein
MMLARGASAVCAHIDHVPVTQLPESVAECEDSLANGGKWLHPRICLECGRIGCCDDSPARHASARAHATDHPLIRSLEPHEEWCWCAADKVAIVILAVRGRKWIPPSLLQW